MRSRVGRAIEEKSTCPSRQLLASHDGEDMQSTPLHAGLNCRAVVIGQSGVIQAPLGIAPSAIFQCFVLSSPPFCVVKQFLCRGVSIVVSDMPKLIASLYFVVFVISDISLYVALLLLD